MDDLPYKVEYARTGRASCKRCKANIGKDSLRVAQMVKSAFKDGMQPNWFHQACFFQLQRPQSVGDIAGFESIRYEDQQAFRKQIEEPVVVAVPTIGKKGKKRAADEATADGCMTALASAAAKDFGIEYAKSARSECRGCSSKILKNEIRVKKVSFDTDVGKKYGGQALWHHLDCFAKLRTELGWPFDGKLLPGYEQLKADNRNAVDAALPAVTAADVAQIKKAKVEEIKDEVDSAHDAQLEQTLAAQSREFFENRDACERQLGKSELTCLLQMNDQDVPSGTYLLLEAVADLLTFGALERCAKCGGQFVFNKSSYMCDGNLDEWVKCETIEREPARRVCRISKELLEKRPFLDREYLVKTRAVRYVAPTAVAAPVKKEKELAAGPKVQRERPALYDLEFVMVGRIEGRAELKEAIERLGGKVVMRVHDKLAAAVATETEVARMSAKMEEVKALGIQVVRPAFVEELGELGAIEYIRTRTICDWGTDPLVRIPNDEDKDKSTKPVVKSVTLMVNTDTGTAVDPESGLDGVSRVLIADKIKYFCVLGLTDIQSDKNSYYKMQLLKSTMTRNSYQIFRAWGRIGTTIGGKKIDHYADENVAIAAFHALYEERTGNRFGDATQTKKPGRYFPVETDYGNDNNAIEPAVDDAPTVASELDGAVQNVIKLMFDLEMMKKAMVAFDLDMEKMPLGKLSQRQLSDALKVLARIAELIKAGAQQSQFIAASNQFYTLIPHDFGVARPPVIQTTEMVTTKTEMLESLMEMEFAYGLMKTESASNADSKRVNPIDAHYKQLKTTLRTLAHDSEEFKLLVQYVRNSHAVTHGNYDLHVVDIFAVERANEAQRYEPFRKLHNRQLLWHGSRLSNFVGILSNGLKIAPPEAPATGYMFGKGIYFADRVSKSANYCCTSPANSTGLMMLCEVALGNMLKCHSSKYVTALPQDKQSTWGVGMTQPDVAEQHVREDGVIVPLGRSKSDWALRSALQHNEFIVYDVAQVNVQYLFKMEFEYKY